MVLTLLLDNISQASPPPSHVCLADNCLQLCAEIKIVLYHFLAGGEGGSWGLGPSIKQGQDQI